MTIDEVKDFLVNLNGHITFEYKGHLSCGIDPISQDTFDMWMDLDEITAHSIEDVLNIKFFDGKSLTEIWNDITDLEF